MFDPQKWRVSVEEKGVEREPLLVIDGFVADPQGLVEAARSAAFAPITPHYPGLRAPLAPAAQEAMTQALQPLCEKTFGVAPGLEAAFYSLVTTPPERLTPFQRLPHFDGVEPHRLALVAYLCAPEHGGTAFFRHRSTRFETIGAERFTAYRSALEADVRRFGLPPPAYIAGDTPLFERIAAPAPAFNRALVYRGRNLHSGDIAPGFGFDPDPARGRLTITAFFL